MTKETEPTEQKFLDLRDEIENFHHGDREDAAAAVGAVAVLFEAGTLRPRLGAAGRPGDPLRGGRHGDRPGLTGTTGDGQTLQDDRKVDPEREMRGTR